MKAGLSDPDEGEDVAADAVHAVSGGRKTWSIQRRPWP